MQTSIGIYHAISSASVCNIFRETCVAISDVLSPYMTAPSSSEEWEDVARGFKEKWDFPHCLGAIDGKHVVIKVRLHSSRVFCTPIVAIGLMWWGVF